MVALRDVDVEGRWGLAGAAGGARACQIHEMPHKQVNFGKEQRKYEQKLQDEERKVEHVLGSAGSGSVQK
jgi:hypothetical protein